MQILKKIHWWLIDYMYMFLGYSRSAIYRSLPKNYNNENNEKGNIVLIPGLFTSWHFLKNIGDYFASSGYRIHIVPTISYNHRAISLEADELHQYLEEHGLINVKIIAHSKGGLVGKYYMENENILDHRVTKLIAIATPFSGSYLAGVSPLKAMKELSPDSQLISDLNKKNKNNINTVSIFPSHDNHVKHKNKSFLKGAKNIELETKGHHKILFEKELVEVLESELKFNF